MGGDACSTGPVGGAASMLKLLYRGLKWLVSNGRKVACLLRQLFSWLSWVLRVLSPCAG